MIYKKTFGIGLGMETVGDISELTKKNTSSNQDDSKGLVGEWQILEYPQTKNSSNFKKHLENIS
jgi:hypothetical protein